MNPEADFGGWPLFERDFFKPSASVVARRLLGHALVRSTPQGLVGGIIVETEAYLFDDPASHSFRGMTQRNAAMFGHPGFTYVYFIYGCHHCINAVCQENGVGEAVLIRALEIIGPDPRAASGPGKICKWLGINRSHDSMDLCSGSSEVQIRQNPKADELVTAMGGAATTPRIGITRGAVERLRFVISGSPMLTRKFVALKD